MKANAALFSLILIMILCVTFQPARALWLEDGLPVTDYARPSFIDYPHIVSDGAGGTFITWYDFRDGDTNIYIQRTDADGNLLWNINGVAVCTDPYNQYNPGVVPDGSGGAIIAWHDLRNSDSDIYAQRVDSTGAIQWVVDGVLICGATGSQYVPLVTTDGARGAIITWKDSRAGNQDIYTQRIDAEGTVQWTADGVAVCTTTDKQEYYNSVSDGSGGVIITWCDNRAGLSMNWDVYAQRVNNSGVVQWTADGIVICGVAGFSIYPQITSNGSGGAIIAWEDQRGDQDIYAQCVDSVGTVQWTANGIPVCTYANIQSTPGIVSDGTGGAIITWADSRGTFGNIYAQRINAAGSSQWIANGVAVCSTTASRIYPRIVSDGSGGAVIAWTDFRDVNYERIYAQRINGSGVTQWTADGVIFSELGVRQSGWQIISDGGGGIIAVWRYEPNTSGDYYLNSQRIDGAGAPVWSEMGSMICTPEKGQTETEIASDGTGGAIVTWVDQRRVHDDIVSQHLDGDGDVLWAAEGVPVCMAEGYQDNPEPVYDGAGCVVVAWRDRRAGFDNMDIYAQRINTSGAVQWAIDGIPICSAVDNQEHHQIISDGSGGTIIVWMDSRSGEQDIYAQRVDASGTFLWDTNGVAICSALNIQGFPVLISDGAGGAIITWHDYRNGMDNFDIYAQRINNAGTVQWAADGVALCSAVEPQVYPRIVSDGQGGAIVSWDDARWPGNTYAQRIDSGGVVQWTADGVLACNSPGYQSHNEISSDGAGGAIIAWNDIRDSTNGIYAQRIDASGAVRWPAEGLSICSLPGSRYDVRIVSDDEGGAVLTWRDGRNGNGDFFTQRVDSTGTILWLADGVAVCDDVSYQDDHDILSDGAHGAFVAWNDARTGFDLVYLHRITELGLGPVCEVTPVSIEIPGYVEVSSYVDTMFTITNTGFGTLVGYVYLQSDEFSIIFGGGQFSLLRGETREVTVRFMPTVAGSYECTIDAGMFICSDVSVSGVAFVCPTDSVLYVDVDAAGVDDGSSWADAYTDLSDALTIAPVCPSITQVWVAEGTYFPSNSTGRDATFQLVDGLAVCGGFAGDETALSQRDYLLNETILSGDIGIADNNSDNCSHVVTGTGTDTTAILSGFIVEKGNADGTIVPGNSGGGMLNYVGSPTISNCIFRNNSSSRGGGGMYTLQGDIRIRNTKFENNNSGLLGGGIYQDYGELSLIDVSFVENTSGWGAGMYTRQCLITLINGVYYSNSAAYAGAMGTVNPRAGSKILNTSLISNTAIIEMGSMYNIYGGSNLEIINVISWGNSAPSYPEFYNSNCTPVVSYSDIAGCGGSGGGWDISFGTDGGGNIDDNPLFYDEPGGDLRLATGSPAIDTGNGSVPGLPSTDFAGKPRVQGLEVDMGAYEGATVPGNVRITTSPEGLGIEVVGETQTGPYDTVMAIGSEFSISAPSPQPSGDHVYVFTGWSDGGDTTHTVTTSTSDTTFTASFIELAAYALIDSIVDVPDDQGGWARIHFARSYYDDVGETQYPIDEYDIHRRIDDVGLAAVIFEKGEAIADDVTVILPDGSEKILSPADLPKGARYISYKDRYFLIVSAEAGVGPSSVSGDRDLPAAPPGMWEVIGDVSAMQQDTYVYLAPTLADSAASLTYTAFYISAHTTTPAVFFESPPDSGYSVDNIAPGVPLGLTVAYNMGDGNQLAWDPSSEPDFQYYRVYCGTDESFVPGLGTEVHSTSDPFWTDPDNHGSGVYYKITAVDHVGNESAPASPTTTTDSSDPGMPKVYSLGQNVPNPFNPSTTVYYDVPEGGGEVSIRVFDVSGRLVRTLVNGHQTAGSKSVTWSGANDRGQSVSSGIYFYRMTAPGFTRTRKMVLLR